MKTTSPNCCRMRIGLRAFAGVLLIAAPSCRLLQGAVEAPGKLLEPSVEEKHASAAAVQSSVMRFADRFDAEILQATNDFAARVGTPEARIQALDWSISARTAALTIAAGPNPNVGLLDMLVAVTLGRMVHEEHWMPDVWGEADQPMVEAYRSLETEIWEIAGNSLNPKQLEEIRALIDTWRKDNPAQSVTTFVRLPHFEHLLASLHDKESNVFEDLGKLFSLDPLAGLEPAKREVAQARLLGERVLYYLERAPLVFSAQAELLGLKMAMMPEVQTALEKSGQVSQAAASLAETAASLPAVIRAERQEAIRQLSEELTLQREGVVQNLESAQAPVGKMLENARNTIDSAKEMSAVVQSAVQSLDAFIARQKEDPGRTQDTELPGRPFDVREYGEAAAQVGAAAKELNAFLAVVDRSEAQSERLLDEVQRRSDRSLDRALSRLLVIGLILIGAAAAAALAVRRISARRSLPVAAERSGRTAEGAVRASNARG
jgi:hypothetical protein